MSDESPQPPAPTDNGRPRDGKPARGGLPKPGGKPDGPPGTRRRTPQPTRPGTQTPLILGGLALVVLLLFLWDRQAGGVGREVDYSFFLEQVLAGNVAEAEIVGQRVTGEWKAIPANPDREGPELSEEFRTVIPPYALTDGSRLDAALREGGVRVSAEVGEYGTGTLLMISLLGTGAIILLFWVVIRRSADPMGGGGMLGGFTKSPAKRFAEGDRRVTFDDVAGMEQAKRDLQEIVEFLKNPAKFQRLGAEIPKGVLLMGSPGTGKTLVARATAGEAEVPFYSISGSEFIQMFVGVGASRVRDLFKTAKENAPCIIFIDEVDAVGRQRGAGMGGGHDEREQTLNQILSEMDGFTPSETVIVMAATNRPDVLDPALLRPGRFDRHVQVDKPTKEGRVGILKVHTKKVPLDDDVDLERVAAGTIGFSGAELKNLVNEAALLATRFGRKAVTMEDFEESRDKVLMGAAREEILSEHERRMTAYHEAGHALIAWILPHLDPVHKVTVIPRGRALGVTQLLPDEERFHVGENKLRDQLAMAMGGRAAEKLVFDEYSAGAEMDLRQATEIARKMVSHWGMSEKVGPVAFRQGEEHPFLGREMQTARNFSDETARLIDGEVQRILREANERAMELLVGRRDDMERMVEELLARESLSRADMADLLGEREPHPTAGLNGRPLRDPDRELALEAEA